LLELKNVGVKYGIIPAIQKVNIKVEQGRIVSLIGANGAGKTTTLKSIVGVLKPFQGQIFYQGREITNRPVPWRVRQGICLVPEGRGIFNRLSVKENLLIGAYHRQSEAEIQEDLELVYSLFPRLKERENQVAGTLSGGEQQMLALGRGLMSRPQLMLLDEPSLGLAPLVVKELYELIKEIREKGVTILLVEQNAVMAIKVSDYIYVLEAGEVKMEGPPEKIESLEDVRRVYLGG